MKTNNKKVLIIGSGIGGLSLGCLLAKEGYKVTIVEKNKQFGGRGRVLKTKGFVFDMGPSWYLLPEVFEEFFQIFDKKASDYYELVRLDPSYRVYLPDNKKIDISSDLEKNLKLFSYIEKDGDKKFKNYLGKAQKIYEILVGELFYEDLTSRSMLMSPKMLQSFKGLDPRDLFGSFGSFTKKYFKSEDMRRIVEYGVALIGSHPDKAPGFYAMMSHADFNLGVYYIKGGMGMLFNALYDLSKELGVEYIFDDEVTKIIAQKRTVNGVRLKSGKVFKPDLVVSNADYAHTEINLLDKEFQTYDSKYWENTSKAPSAFIIYLGIDKKLPGLLYHNLFLDRDWKKHFEMFYDREAKWPKNPAYYVCCPTKNDESVAPKGSENIFITVPIPSGVEDTEEIRDKYFSEILKHLESKLDTNLSNHIVYKRIFSQNDFKSDYNAYNGTALGLMNTLRQSSIFRVKFQSQKLNNLYYVGQYTHPGSGLSACIASARIVSRKIVEQS